MANKPETNIPANDIPVLLKIGEYFIPQQQVRSIARFGKGCKIMLASGNEILVKINFEKISELINK